MSKNLAIIDGSILEGGGQILRMALTFSALCEIPIRINNIRAGRSKPGLAAQHLKSIEIVAQMCSADIRNGRIGSTEIEFWPKRLQSGTYNADTQTAGSVSLLLQASVPCGMFTMSGCDLHLRGGTNAEMAPQIDYTLDVFKPNLEMFGGHVDINLNRRGYFPRGGGIVSVRVDPVSYLRPIQLLDPGYVISVEGKSFIAGRRNNDDAVEMANVATNRLKAVYPNAQINIRSFREENGSGDCSAINLACRTSTGCVFGGSSLGTRANQNVPEPIGYAAAEELLNHLQKGACVDEHMQDQIIVYMALADGISRVRVGELTLHTKTAIYIAELLTKAKFNIIPENTGTSVIECQGISLRNPYRCW